MSWTDDARKLLAQGKFYESHETALFLARVEASQAYGGVSIDHAVSQLPPSCRAQANGIMKDARANGVNDFEIAQQLCDLTESPMDPISSRDHATTFTHNNGVSQNWEGCVYFDGWMQSPQDSDGMAGNPF